MSIGIAAQRTSFSRALSSLPFALMWFGQTTSTIGDYAFTTALAWQVLILTGSATLVGLIVSMQIVMQMLFVLLGGVAADRLPRRLVMLSSDFGRAVVVLGIAVLSWFHFLHVWHLFVLAVLFGLVQGFFQPAYQSIIPELVTEDALPSANALTSLSRTIGKLVGPLLSAACIALIGPALVFVFDGVTFLIAGLCMVRPYSLESSISQSPKEGHMWTIGKFLIQIQHILRDIYEGFAYTRRSKWLWISFAAEAIMNMTIIGATEVAFPKLIHDMYHTGAWLLGCVVTAGALGVVLATVLVSRIQRGHRGVIIYLLAISACFGTLFVGMPLPWINRAFVVCFSNMIIGFGLGGFSILLNTLVQENVEATKLGRVYSLNILGSLCLVPLGFFLAGIGSDQIGPAVIFLIDGAIALFLMCAILCTPAIRRVS